MKTNFERVKEFHALFKHPVDGPMTPTSLEFRWDLICEEADETFRELYTGVDLEAGAPAIDIETINLAKLTKELADLLYVIYGFAVQFGLPIDEVFAKVHESNMSKLGPNKEPIYNEAGKVMKGPNYQPPDIEGLFNGTE